MLQLHTTALLPQSILQLQVDTNTFLREIRIVLVDRVDRTVGELV